jgi:hypothetical protein
MSSSVPELTADQMLDLLRQAFSPGNWFKFPLQFLDLMTMQEAVLLAYLNNHADKCDRHAEWFFCPATKIEADLRMIDRTQNSWLTRLKNRGFLESEKRGMPGRRHFRINWELIAHKLHGQLESD